MKTTRMTLRLAFGLAMALPVAGLAACGKKEEAPTATTQPAADGGGGGEGEQPRRGLETPDKPAQGQPQAGAPQLPGPFASAGLTGVPKSAPFVLVVSPKKVLDGLGYQALADKYAPLLASVGDKMMEVSGKDFFKLSSWAEIGVDLDSPLGVYMPELATPALITFARLSDAAKFEKFVGDTAKKVEASLTSEKVGEATLITVGKNDRNAWLVRADTLFAVAMLEGNGAAAMAKEIVTRKPEDSIAALPELKAAIDGLAADELGAFVQLRTILEQTAMREYDAPPTFSTANYERELEEARKAGDKDAIQRLEATIASEKQFSERYAKRWQAEAKLAKSLVAELSTLAIGVDMTPEAVEAVVRLPLAAGGRARGLLKNASGTQPILKATKEQPLLVLSGQLELVSYLALLEELMASDGENLDEARRELKEKLGIDLDKDILEALTGEVGFALTADLAQLFQAKDPRAALGGAFSVGLKSDAGIKAHIARFAAMEDVRQVLTWDEATSTATVSLPEAPKFQVVFADGRLLASTDLGTAARMAGGESFVSALSNPKLKALYERKDLAGLFAMQQSFAGAWLIGMGKGRDWSPPLPPDAPPEAKAKQEELEKLKAEIEPLRKSVEEKRMKPVLDTFAKMGTFAEAVTMDAQGMTATFGLYPSGATVPEVVTALVDMGISMQREQDAASTDDEKKLRELEERRYRLESELWNLAQPKEEIAVPPEEKKP